MDDVLELGPDGWLRNGESWQPIQPFFAVMGNPVAHSLSPAMQGAALMEREIDAEYLALRIEPGMLRHLKVSPAGWHLAGFNVTAPLKEAVAALCDGRTDQARDTGVVNTVKVEDGKWMGHNTDSGGILTVLTEAWGDRDMARRAVVLGAGGSACAAVDALVRWGIEEIEVHNRSVAGREKIESWITGRALTDQVKVLPLREGAEAVPKSATVWVCCLAGGVDAMPYLPVAAGQAPALLLDLRYGDQLPESHAPLGFGFQDGLPVLLVQGGLSFAWWFGPPVPWDRMRGALSD